MYGEIDGYYEPAAAVTTTGNDFNCQRCLTPVVFGTPSECYSLETKHQIEHRWCTRCWQEARKPAKAAAGNDRSKP